MDASNIKEAIKEASMDIREGADILLVKPGIMYLDVLKEIKRNLIFLLSATRYLVSIQ